MQPILLIWDLRAFGKPVTLKHEKISFQDDCSSNSAPNTKSNENLFRKAFAKFTTRILKMPRLSLSP